MFKNIPLKNEKSTIKLGEVLFQYTEIGDIITLSGIIGSGKTTLARGFIRKATDCSVIPSPTYNLIKTYHSSKGEIWHFDAWRIKDPIEILELGLLEAFDNAIIIIEWPENVKFFIPNNHLNISINLKNNIRYADIITNDEWNKKLKTFNFNF